MARSQKQKMSAQGEARWLRRSAIALACLGGLAGGHAIADPSQSPSDAAATPGPNTGQLQEIIVTANRLGAENLQNVPTSISALNAESFDRQGLQSLGDITFGTPGISVAELGGGQNTIVIRGITTVGAPDPTNVETQAPVSVYLDDTPISLAGATPSLRLFDFERVEVVRGPQGTLYGAGAMAGNVRYVTRKPDSSGYDALLESSGIDAPRGGVGYSVRGMFNAPLVDNALALRLTAYEGEDPGYIFNIARDDRNSNWQMNTQARAALRFDNQGPLVLDASILYGRTRTGAYANYVYADLPDDQFSATSPEYYKDEFTISNLTLNYRASSFDVISSTSYVDRKTGGSTSSENVVNYFLGYTTLSSGIFSNNIHDFTQEFRATTVDWSHFRGQLGVFYEDQHRKYTQDTPTEGVDAVVGLDSLSFGAFNENDIFSEYQTPDTEQLAEFGEATYSPTDNFDLTVGLRHFDWRQSFYLYSGGLFGALAPGQPLTTNRKSTESGNNPKVNLAYHINSDSIVFAEAAKGFRYGGINQPIPDALCAAALAAYGLTSGPLTYGPDSLWTYSLGEKATALDKKLTVNTTAFLTRWSDIQTLAPLSSCGYYFTQNKGDVKSTGLEFESHWLAARELTLGLNASYTDSVADGPIQNLNAISGARTPYFPKVIVGLQADYAPTTPLGNFLLHADYTYRGDMVTNFDPTNALLYRVITSTRVLNAAVTLTHGHFDFTAYGRNLTNERVISVISPNLYGASQPYGDELAVGPPLTVGLRVTWHLHRAGP